MVLTEHPNARTAQVRSLVTTHVSEETAVDDLEPAATNPHGATSVVLELVLGIRVDKREILHREPRVVLVLTVISGPHLIWVTGIHIQNATAASSTERYQSPAVNDDFGPRIVEYLGRLLERDGDRHERQRGPEVAAFGCGRRRPR